MVGMYKKKNKIGNSFIIIQIDIKKNNKNSCVSLKTRDGDK